LSFFNKARNFRGIADNWQFLQVAFRIVYIRISKRKCFADLTEKQTLPHIRKYERAPFKLIFQPPVKSDVKLPFHTRTKKTSAQPNVNVPLRAKFFDGRNGISVLKLCYYFRYRTCSSLLNRYRIWIEKRAYRNW
jgi:hypothetical protein